MATYGSNTTLKVNGAVSATMSGSGTLYTAPASGYSVIQLGTTSNSVWTITIGSRNVAIGYSTNGSGSAVRTFYVGPSQAVAATLTSGSGALEASGVEFVNTP